MRPGRAANGAASPDRADVAEEVPVAFVYGGKPHVVMMCTPTALEDLAIGFTVSEEIVSHARDVVGVEVVRHARGIEVQMELPPAAQERVAARTRALDGRTGCGLCGIDAIGEAIRTPRPVAAGATFTGGGNFGQALNLDRNRRTGIGHGLAVFVQHGAHTTVGRARKHHVAALERAALHQHRRDRALTLVELSFHHQTLGRRVDRRLQFQHFSLQQHVFRLYVAVNDPEAVGVPQRREYLQMRLEERMLTAWTGGSMPPGMRINERTKADAERILGALKNEEKNVKKKLQKKSPVRVQVEKDW